MHMSEEDLEVLITLDDPVEDDEEDNFHHLQAEEFDGSWPGQSVPGERPHSSANPTNDGREAEKDDLKGPKLKT
jgi:hypothetical protein